jgi:hypothetical protein
LRRRAREEGEVEVASKGVKSRKPQREAREGKTAGDTDIRPPSLHVDLLAVHRLEDVAHIEEHLGLIREFLGEPSR